MISIKMEEDWKKRKHVVEDVAQLLGEQGTEDLWNGW